MFFEGDVSALLPACPPVACSESSYLEYLGAYSKAVGECVQIQSKYLDLIRDGFLLRGRASGRGGAAGLVVELDARGACGDDGGVGGVGRASGDVDGGSSVAAGGGSHGALGGVGGAHRGDEDATDVRVSACQGGSGDGARDGSIDGPGVGCGVVDGITTGFADGDDARTTVGIPEGRSAGGDSVATTRESGCSGFGGAGGLRLGVSEGALPLGAARGKHYAKNRAKKERVKQMKKEAAMRRSWRGGYCETLSSGKPSSVPSSCPGLSSAATSQSLVDAEAAARESLAKRRVVENELAMAKAKAQIASYADVEKSKAIAELKIARIAQWNNEARMKSQKSWADYKRSLENSPVPSFKASDLPSAASAGEYWWKQQCLKSKEMEEQIKHLEAIIKASMPYVSPEGLEKMREVPDPEPVIDPEFEALKRAHRELAVAEGLDGYDSGDDIGYDLFMPPSGL